MHIVIIAPGAKLQVPRYTIVLTGRKQGIHGAARIDNQLDKCFCLLLELLSFGWIGTATL